MAPPNAQLATSGLDARSHARTRNFAAVVVADECQRRRIDRGLLRAQLTDTVATAVARFLTVRRARFPLLTAALASRFADDTLPRSTVRALRRVALRAVAASLDPVRSGNRQGPPAKRRQPRGANVRVLLSRESIFVGTAWTDPVGGAPVDPAALYRETARGTALRAVARAVGETSPRVRDDLVLTAECAIGEFLARRVVRFPKLASQLLARFSSVLLPRPTWLALRRAVRIAIRERARSLAVHPPFARVRPMPRPDAATVEVVNTRIDALLVRVREAGAQNDRSRHNVRSRAAHIASLEESRACLLGHDR